MNFLIWASIEMVISNNPWFVYDEDIFTPKELDNFKKSYAKALVVRIDQIEEKLVLLKNAKRQ